MDVECSRKSESKCAKKSTDYDDKEVNHESSFRLVFNRAVVHEVGDGMIGAPCSDERSQ